MHLNMYMVADQLSLGVKTWHFTACAKRDILTHVKIYHEEIPISNRYLYLVDGKNFPNISPQEESLNYVFLGGVVDTSLFEHCDYIVLKEEKSLLSVFDILQQIFEKYNLWEDELLTIVNDDADIQKLCDRSQQFFRNPIIVHNGNFEVLATTANREAMDAMDFFYQEDVECYVASTVLLNIFELSPLYYDTIHKKNVENYHADYPAYDVLYINLSGEGFFPGRVIIPEYVCENTFYVYGVLRRLGEIVSIAISRHNAMRKGYRGALESMFVRLLQGSVIEQGHIDFCLQSKEWKTKDRYCCFVVTVKEAEARSFSITYCCQQLEKILGDCFAFFYDAGIVCICHFSKDEKTITTIGTELGTFLRDGFFKAGISNMFDNLYEAEFYYQQAKSAISIGNILDPQIWYYPFKKYALFYMLYYGIGKMPVEIFVDERILKLKSLGKKEGVDYFQTLKVYLENNMSLLHSSEALFIHRTTLFYRINRIKEFLEVDFNDKDIRIPMLISYYLLDLAGNTSKNGR